MIEIKSNNLTIIFNGLNQHIIGAEEIMDIKQAKKDVLGQERLRMAALLSGDAGALAHLLSDDLIHIHATGAVDDKPTFLHNIANVYKFEALERGDINIHKMGEMILLSGLVKQVVVVLQTGQRHVVEAIVSQLWRHENGAWRQCFFQSSRLQ
jgi:hypothetical protein